MNRLRIEKWFLERGLPSAVRIMALWVYFWLVGVSPQSIVGVFIVIFTTALTMGYERAARENPL